MDLFPLSVDLVSVLSLLLVGIVGAKAIRAFHQSKQALTESASLISVIVDALTSRIERYELFFFELRKGVETLSRRSENLEGEQASLRASHLQLLHHLQEILSNDKKLVIELEQLKSKLGGLQLRGPKAEALPKRENLAVVISDGELLASLTLTERRTLEILRDEGAKAAPELGRRLKKSREHTSRLMKKLYMDGYVDRESNRAPFRYKLNETLRTALGGTGKRITAMSSETS
jgi:chromosome segregation ATPase